MAMMTCNDMHRTQLGCCVLLITAFTSACSGGGGDGATSASSTPSSTSSAVTTASSTSTLAVTGEPPQTAVLGAAYYFNAGVAGNARGAVTYSIRNKPAWITLNTTTGELKGTPTTTGTFANITISASDGHSSATLAPFSIRVVDERANVALSWAAPTKNTDGTDIDNLAGFAIHYGVSPNALNKVVNVASRNARSYLFTDLSKGTTYYFAVAAVNDMNVEGTLSPVTSIAL